MKYKYYVPAHHISNLYALFAKRRPVEDAGIMWPRGICLISDTAERI
jgi:hypothetical protein